MRVSYDKDMKMKKVVGLKNKLMSSYMICSRNKTFICVLCE